MPASEIDDIFASKGKGKGKEKALPKEDPVEVVVVVPSKVKRKRDKKRKADALDATPSASKKVSVTVFKEPSRDDSLAYKRQKTAKSADSSTKLSKKQDKDADNDDTRFKDSRGTGPRRKTEEGWSVYKEDELGIGDEGGDTPLCPFDCRCCF